MIRVGIVDDHPVTLWGLRSALESSSDITVVAACTGPESLDPRQLDVVVLDLHLAGEQPIVALTAAMSVHTRVVMMFASGHIADLTRCMRAGARAYVHKSSPPERFAEAVHFVAAGGMTPPPVEQVNAAPALSPREQAVLDHIADGLTRDQIANRLHISKYTVDTYLKRVRAKLNLGNKADLTRAALAMTRAPWPANSSAATGSAAGGQHLKRAG